MALAGRDVIERADLGLADEVLQEVGAGAVEADQASAALPAAAPTLAPSQPLPNDLATYLDGIEREILERALERHRYNRTAAGASLGLSLRQMRYRMARLGVGSSTNGDTEQGEMV